MKAVGCRRQFHSLGFAQCHRFDLCATHQVVLNRNFKEGWITMLKRIILAVIAIFVAWSALDFVIHGLILGPTYAATPQLWRPMNEMKMGILHVSVLLTAVAFVCIYAFLAGRKNVVSGLLFGLLFGLGTGVSMGFGTYSVMPIPLDMAIVWFVGTVVEFVVGGVTVGFIVKE